MKHTLLDRHMRELTSETFNDALARSFLNHVETFQSSFKEVNEAITDIVIRQSSFAPLVEGFAISRIAKAVTISVRPREGTPKAHVQPEDRKQEENDPC